MSFKSDLRESRNLSTADLFFNLMELSLKKKASVTISKHLDDKDEIVLVVKIHDIQKPSQSALFSTFGTNFYRQYLDAKEFLGLLHS